jgi:hypothetical protein
MREKALAVDNSGRFLIEYFFEFNYYVDNFARRRSLLVNADMIISPVIKKYYGVCYPLLTHCS